MSWAAPNSLHDGVLSVWSLLLRSFAGPHAHAKCIGMLSHAGRDTSLMGGKRLAMVTLDY